jgi:hypothetical protein
MEIIKTESSEFLICWNEKNAKRRFNTLFNSIKHLPPVIADFVKRLCKNLDRELITCDMTFYLILIIRLSVIMVLHFLKEKKDL